MVQAIPPQVRNSPPIPGQRHIDAPAGGDAARLVRMRPFVRQSGDEWREPWLLRRRKLLDYLLVYIAEGDGRFVVGEQSFGVSAGDVVWIPPDTVHEMAGMHRLMHVLYVHFDLLYDPRRSHWDACIPGEVLDLRPWRHLMHPPVDDPVIGRWCGKLPVRTTAAVMSLTETICLEHRRTPAASGILFSGLMLQLLHELLSGVAEKYGGGGLHDRDMRRAAAIIHESTDRELDVGALAQRMGLSESHFRKLFRETHGLSARATHRRARMQRACKLLAYSRLNVSQVAHALGFATVHNFSRAFHEVVGMSPSQYRQGR